MSKSLTISQRSEYNARKKRIKQWCGERFQVGEDLLAIRDQKLYIDDYKTFEECCEKEFALQRSQSYRLMDASAVKSSLQMSPIGDKIVRPSQALALVDVPEKKRAAVVRAAADTGTVTAKSLSKAAEKILAPHKNGTTPEPEVEYDQSGYPVPAPALAYWNRRDEPNEYLQLISKARSAIHSLVAKLEAEKKPDQLYTEVNLKNVYAKLSQAYTEMTLAVPKFVCGICQGQTPKTCTLCKGRGVISRNKWDTCVAVEIKNIRKKSSRK